MLFRKILLITLIPTASFACASTVSTHTHSVVTPIQETFAPGPYVGINTGLAQFHDYAVSSEMSSWTNSVDFKNRKSLGVGIFLGYDFTDVFALELGLTHFPGPKVESTITQTTRTSYKSQTIPSQAIDLLAKLKIPVGNYVNLYGKVGAAWVEQESASHTITTALGATQDVSVVDSQRRLAPEAGLGVSVFSNPNGQFQVGYNRIFGSNKISDIDYLYASISYKFAY